MGNCTSTSQVENVHCPSCGCHYCPTCKTVIPNHSLPKSDSIPMNHADQVYLKGPDTPTYTNKSRYVESNSRVIPQDRKVETFVQEEKHELPPLKSDTEGKQTQPIPPFKPKATLTTTNGMLEKNIDEPEITIEPDHFYKHKKDFIDEELQSMVSSQSPELHVPQATKRNLENASPLTPDSPNTISYKDPKTGVKTYWKKDIQSVSAVCFSPQSGAASKLAVSNRQNLVKVYDINTGKEIIRMQRDHQINCLAFSMDETMLVVAGEGKTVTLYKVDDGKEILSIHRNDSALAVSFSPKGDKLAVCGYDMRASIYNIYASGTFDEYVTIIRTNIISALAWSPDGALLAVGGFDNRAAIYDVKTAEEKLNIRRNNIIFAMAFSPDSSKLAVGGCDRNTSIYDAKTGKKLQNIECEDTIYAISFSRDGTKIATGGEDKEVIVYDIETGEKVTTITRNNPVRALSFSTNDSTVNACG